MMKIIKNVLPLVLFMFIGLMATAQTAQKAVNKEVAKTEMTKKDAKCNPAACDALVKAGICTPAQAAKCKETGKSCIKSASTTTNTAKVKVASLSKERPATTGNAKTAKSKKACAKSCTGAKKIGG